MTGAGSPVVAGLLGLGAAGVAAAVVAMAWSVLTHQIRLAEQLARRQFIVTSAAHGAVQQAMNADPTAIPEAAEQNGAAGEAVAARNGTATGARTRSAAARAAAPEAPRPGPPPTARPSASQGTRAASQAARAAPPPVVIEGPDTVVAGEQARYRARMSGNQQVVAWAAGGGAVSQAPDPAHPGDLLLIADQPGNLIVSVRVREGLTERRETKAVTAVPEVTGVTPPMPLRLFLQGWGLIVVAVLIVGFAGSLAALGSLSSGDFIALVVPLVALLGVLAVVRGSDTPTARPAAREPVAQAFRRYAARAPENDGAG
jgi:hypothetical protein